jgi:predicted heme/steroid binding protein
VSELRRYDGYSAPAYVAYHRRVFDVSGSALWRDGLHQGLHWAGQDLTSFLALAPHGPENLDRFPLVGELVEDDEREKPA